MKGKVSFCLRILALLITFSHVRNAVARIASLDLDSQPLADSPAAAAAAPAVFDVTSYEAIADGKTECSKAFLEAWNDACSHPGNSTLYIPEGTYLVGPVTFVGPCHNNQSPTVKIDGSLIALSGLKAFPEFKWIEFKDLNGIILTGNLEATNLDGQGAVEAWKQPSCSFQCEILITSVKFSNVSDGSISNITLSNSKGFHVVFQNSNNVNVENVAITSPWDSPNTDGIHIYDSTNIAIMSSAIGVGDDCVSIGSGSINISVSDVNCGPGHGISIGSLGKYADEKDVVDISVENCTINGTQNGVRVKTFPSSSASSASDITFENIVLINVSNPIIIDQQYCPSNKCDTSKPSLVKLSSIEVKNVIGTFNSEFAVDLVCSYGAACENISLIDINLNYTLSDEAKQGGMSLKGVVNGLQIDGCSF